MPSPIDLPTALSDLIPDLQCLANHLTGEKERARELCQETLLRLWRHGGTADEIDNLPVYARTTMRKLHRESLRNAAMITGLNEDHIICVPSAYAQPEKSNGPHSAQSGTKRGGAKLKFSERNNPINRIEITRPLAIMAAFYAYSALSMAIAFIMYRDADLFAVSWRQHFSEAELTATIIFGFVGAASASAMIPRNAPYLRATIVVFLAAFCTANGGGTIRDILSNQLPFWISSPEYIVIPGISTLLMVSMMVSCSKTVKHIFDLAEDLSTGIFCCLGTFKAADLVGTDSPTFFLLAIILGTMTAVGGGILRDVAILRRRPRALTTSVGLCVVLGAFVHASFLYSAALTDIKFMQIPDWLIISLIIMVSIEFTRHISFFDPAVPDKARPILV